MVKKNEHTDKNILAQAFKDVRPFPGRSIKNSPLTVVERQEPRPPALDLKPKSKKKKDTVFPPLSHSKTPGVDRRSALRLKRGKLPIEGKLDLHGYRQDSGRLALVEFIGLSFSAGRRCVLVITGKGLHAKDNNNIGIMRKMVPIWLNEPPIRERIISFSYATQSDGGVGALYVLLKRQRKKEKNDTIR